MRAWVIPLRWAGRDAATPSLAHDAASQPDLPSAAGPPPHSPRFAAPVRGATGALLLALLGVAPAGAASLALTVRDGDIALEHVVLSLHSESASRAVLAGEGRMDQVDSQFAPRVLAVPVGTSVSFPNRDNTRHHVYSFSPAKRFELPLYSGIPAEPVVFDLPGVVTLGCNIHDWMIGYIHVLDTPHHAVTDASGVAHIEAPAGAYRLRIWHERLLPGAGPEEREVELQEGVAQQIDIALVLAPPPPPRGDERLRALQERFRSLKRDPP